MKRGFFIMLSIALLSSCAPASLYYWGGGDKTTAYEKLAYKSYDTQTPKSLCGLICVYEKMVSAPGGTRQVPPPGICAEYGYLLLQPGTAETFMNNASAMQKSSFKTKDFDALFREKGEAMLKKEIELYPESAVFIEPLIKKLVR